MGSEILGAIAGLLGGQWPKVPIYANPMEQGVKTPCFFLFTPELTAPRRLFEGSQRAGLFQVIYLAGDKSKTPMEERRQVGEALLGLLEQIPIKGGALRPLGLAISVDEEKCQAVFSLRWRVEGLPTEGALICREETVGQVKGLAIDLE